MAKLRACFRILSAAAAALVCAFAVTAGIAQTQFADSYHVLRGQTLQLSEAGFSAKAVSANAVDAALLNTESTGYDTQVLLFGAIPIKTVHVSVTEPQWLIPCGTPFGIKMFTSGVMVVFCINMTPCAS